MIWPARILDFFGPEFTVGADALRLLAIGQLINVAFGPVGASLTMMHKEGAVLTIELVAMACSILLMALALPYYGMLAVAAGSSLAALIRNSLSYLVLHRQLRQFGSSTAPPIG